MTAPEKDVIDELAVATDLELEGRAQEATVLREQTGFVPASPLEELIGRTMSSVVQNGNDAITFEAVTGERWKMYHRESCCESCSIEDVVGDLQDLVGSPIAMADESSNSDDPPPDHDNPESYTWTFYRLATVKGYVTIRWYGSSNGYYSETATFARI